MAARKTTNKLNLDKIQLEYETTNISLRKIAEKYGMSFNTIKGRASAEKWNKKRQDTTTHITTRTRQIVVDKIINTQAAIFDKELESANLMADLILKTLQDATQFNKHLVQRKTRDWDEDGGDERQWIEEKEFTVVDTRRLKALADTLTATEAIKRRMKGVLTTLEQSQLDMAREKLDIDKAKANIDDDTDGNQTGIMQMPAVDLVSYEVEKAAEMARILAEKEGAKNE